jgi:branched-chain amino acid transport system substrate-binding protein
MTKQRDRTFRIIVLMAVGVCLSLAFAVGVAARGLSGERQNANANANSGPTRAVARGKPIIIGAPLGLTGFLNFFDAPSLAGAQIAAAEINAKGGLLGRPLKIITADTKSDLAQGTNAALEVISKGARFVMPTGDYDFGGPAARAAQKKRILSMALVGDPRFGRSGMGPLVFNIYQGTPSEAGSSAQFAYGVKKWRRPYVLADQAGNYTKTLCNWFRDAWKRTAGSSVVGFDTFVNSDASISSQITRLKATRPEPGFIYICTFPPGGTSAIRQIRAAGIRLPILTSADYDTDSWLDAVPGEANTYSAGGGLVKGDPNSARRRVFAAYKKKTGHDLTTSPISLLGGYSIVRAFAKAIKSAGTVNTNAVKAQLEKFRNVATPVGPTTWTAKCHIVLGRAFVYVRPTKKKVFYVASVKPKFIPNRQC